MTNFTNSVEPIFKSQKRSKTETFMKTLTKICLLPVSLDKETNTISYKSWSRPAVLHVIFFVMPTIIMPNLNFFLALFKEVTPEVLEKYLKSQTFVEVASFLSSFLILVSVSYPIILCKHINLLEIDSISRLCQFSLSIFSLFCLRFPKLGYMNVVSFLLVYTGIGFFNIATFDELDVNLYPYFYTMMILGLPMILHWCLTPFIVEMMAESLLIDKHSKCYNNVTKKVDKQKDLSNIFSYFLTVYFSIFQILSVTLLFTGISKFNASEGLNQITIQSFLGMLCTEGNY